jgi:hypothetical protein
MHWSHIGTRAVAATVAGVVLAHTLVSAGECLQRPVKAEAYQSCSPHAHTEVPRPERWCDRAGLLTVPGPRPTSRSLKVSGSTCPAPEM